MVLGALKLILKRGLLLMAFYSLARLVFFIYNFNLMSEAGVFAVAQAFVHGLRFDLYAILWLNIPFWLLAFVPLEKLWKFWPKIEALVFGVWNFIFLGMSFVDVELFRFSGKRLSQEILSLKTDIQDQAWSMITYYWQIVLLGLICMFVLMFLYPTRKFNASVKKSSSWLYSSSLIFAWIVFMVLGMRGGWQLKPIRPIHAFNQSSTAMGALTLNSAFTFIRSHGTDQVTAVSYFDEAKEVGQLIKKEQASRPPLGTHKGKNAVIIILESFSLEFMGWPEKASEQMPFLNELAGDSLFFPYHFANGRRSIDAVPSIVCGLPSLMLEPFPTSNFHGNQVDCLAHVLNDQGYKTLFFHGAQNGSMYIDSFAKRAGFQKFYGMNEYPHPGDSDGHWGIYDGPFFDFAADELTAIDKPFAAVIFSLSSHHPYLIPPEWKGKLPLGKREIDESLAYTDEMLRRFFEKAKSENWYKDTVFFITGDHTSKSEDGRFHSTPGYYRVPLLVHSPGQDLPPSDTSMWVQQADISLSVMDLLGVKAPQFLPFGGSVFNLNRQGHAINYDYTGYWLIKGETFTRMDFGGDLTATGLWQKGAEFMGSEAPSEAEVLENQRLLKAYVQFFRNGLLNNSWLDREHWGLDSGGAE